MSGPPPRDLVWRHIEAIGTCMLVTHDGASVRARPMRGIARPEQNAIWFFTDRDSHKEAQLRAEPVVCLAYADTNNQTYVSVSGAMAVVEDPGTIEELWGEGVAVYYPRGKDDPNILLLKFTPDFGEYWDAPSSPILLAIKFLQAKVSGERPELGTTGSVRLT